GQDNQGNIMVDGSAYEGGGVGYLNKPGISLRDLADVGFTVAAFTPAAKAGSVATTLGKRMATVGAASGVTEAGIDLANQMAGGTEDVAVSNIDPGNVALATLGGEVFEGIGVALSKAFGPAFRQTGEVAPEMRQTFRESAESVGINADEMTDEVIRSYLDRSAGATRGGQAGEFDIRKTQGQQSGEAKQLMLEDRLRSGPSGKARSRMERFSEAQDADVMAARQRELDKMGDGQSIDRPIEAGEMNIEGIRAKAKTAQAATDAAYGDVGQASLSAKGQTGLFTRLKRIAKAEQFDTSEELASTRKAMTMIHDFSDKLKEQGGLAKAQPMRRVESFRKKLNGFINSASNNEDRRQMTIIKREFDKYLDKAIDKALFSGDPDALTQLK
ncbi:unnamed protein product, partial [marine sediment metagenome]